MSADAFSWLALGVSVFSLVTSVAAFIVSEVALRRAKRND